MTLLLLVVTGGLPPNEQPASKSDSATMLPSMGAILRIAGCIIRERISSSSQIAVACMLRRARLHGSHYSKSAPSWQAVPFHLLETPEAVRAGRLTRKSYAAMTMARAQRKTCFASVRQASTSSGDTASSASSGAVWA
jgi:hypothetical protein